MRCTRNYLLTKKYTKALPFSRGSDSAEKSIFTLITSTLKRNELHHDASL